MRTPLVVVLLGLAACGGGGGGDADGGGDTRTRVVATCDAIVDGAVASTPCPGCTIDGAPNVADDDGYTYATVDVPQAAPQAGALLRATAPEGVVFPAESDAGVFLTAPGGGATANLSNGNEVELRTYLDGVLQETDAINNSTQNLPGGDPDLPGSFVSFHTSRDFDAVEVVIGNGDATVGGETVWKVHEICSHGWVDDAF
jgi:hypothetical protein